MALAQPANIQKELFPNFVAIADELALNWEDALQDIDKYKDLMSDEQISSINDLDRYIESISGPQNIEFWTNDALESRPEWDKIRKLSAVIANKFMWPISPPPKSEDIYLQ